MMKRKMKTLLLSAFVAIMASTTAVATVLTVTPAVAETQTSRFAMVEGAAIRYSEPLGLRFIAELGTQEYAELTTNEDGVTKQLGMFIMPYEYIDTNADATIDVTDYASVQTKLDYTFYSSDDSVVNKVYEYTDENGDTYYRANGVISNLKLKNYAREFVGIGYIAETKNGVTTYEYTDISYSQNVRAATYVAIEAHADPEYAEIDNAKRTFEKYVDGAQLYDSWDVTETEDGKYEYNGATYNSFEEVKAEIGTYDYSLTLDSVKYVKEGGAAQLYGDITDTTNPFGFDGAHAVYTSSDESVVKVEESGKLTWVKNGTATITATFMGETQTCDVISGAIDFENGLPSYVTQGGRAKVSVVNGALNVKADVTGENNNNNARASLDKAYMGAMFEDSNIDYLAFDMKFASDFDTTNGSPKTIYYRNYTTGTAWTNYCDYSYNEAYETVPIGYYQTYYYPRAAYEACVANNVSDVGVFINVGAGILENAEGYYIDNIRAVTAEEKAEAHNWYSFEYGGIRTNNGTTVLLYDHEQPDQWQLGFSNVDQTTAKYTSDLVTDGCTAFTFTKESGDVLMQLNNNTETVKETELRNAGYIKYDLYVPEGSDAKLNDPLGNAWYTPLKQGWNTVYVRVDATNFRISRLTDTTCSTYVVDNIRFVSEAEYYENAGSFETGAGALRGATFTDGASETAYWYTGVDVFNNTYSIAISEGSASVLTDVSISSAQVHGGESALSFTKNNGYMSFAMRASSDGVSDMYTRMKNGFTFWVYSTVTVNGNASAGNFINGANGLFNDGEGLTVKANEWMQITVTADDINASGRFLIIQGSTAGTYYLDGFQPLEYYTVTLDAGEGSVTSAEQSVAYGTSYTLETPTPAEGYKFLGWYNGDELVPTTGTWSIESDVTLTAKYEELPKYFYNATGERSDDGTVSGLVLNGGTHDAGDSTSSAMPVAADNTSDMAYYRFHGNYGLNDFLVFDFTGNNMPIVSFFTSDVKNSIYNHAMSENDKGWLFFNGIYNQNGLPDGGYTGNLSNRLNLIGPYKITYKADNSAGETPQSTRTSDGSKPTSPNPVSLAQLNGTTDEYRVIIGWVESGTNMTLRLLVWNLTTGATVYDSKFGSVAKADWEGDIVLYGHFGKATAVNKVYPIAEDTTIDAVAATYKPAMQTYNATWDGNKLTLAASTHSGNDTSNVVPTPSNQVTVDMSYIAFNGTYGLNDYVVFDFTGDNFPFVTFFDSGVTNTIFNYANSTYDSSVRGWIIANGINYENGTAFGGDTGAHSNRILFVGGNKIYQYDDNVSTTQWRTSEGSASSPSPIGMTKLKSVTDTYRAIIGYEDNGGNGAKARIYVINMVTGAVVVDYTKTLANSYQEGSIALHGQFGKTTVLDQVIGVVENTTMTEMIANYGKDTDYSDEEAVELDRYAYSGPSNGTWRDSTNTYHDAHTDGSTCSGYTCTCTDSSCKATHCTADYVDHRTLAEYTTYKDAGFNILLAQDSIPVGVSAWATSEPIMDKAYEAGLKVILTDSRIQNYSEPIYWSSGTLNTAKAWIIGEDVSATSGLAKEYYDLCTAAEITLDTTTFKTRAALDSYIYSCLRLYKDHPAFYGVMLGDEPTYHNAYCYGEIYKSIKRVMPECYVQWNLNPLWDSESFVTNYLTGETGVTDAEAIVTAYKTYLKSFIDSMGVDYVQYDNYPFKSSTETWGIGDWIIGEETTPYIMTTALRNIQAVAEVAKERGIDVKVVTQSLVQRSGGADGDVVIRQLTEDDARWLNNYLMGFGVKQISYFTYWTKSDNATEWFDDGGSFVKRDGTTTALYDFMKTIMANNTAFAPTISHFDYNASQVVTGSSYQYDDGHIAWGTLTSDSFKWVTGVTTSTDATLVTELYDEENYNYMYMVMNTIDPNEKNANGKDTTQTITVTFDSSITEFYVYDQSGNRSLQTGNTYTITLTAGQAVYLMPKL